MRWLWQLSVRIQRTDTLLLLCGQPVIVACYHAVSDDLLPHIKPLYPYKGVVQFEQDAEALASHLMPISLEELISHIHKGERLPRPAILFTFDDGLRCCYTQVAPMLARKGIPAAFFLITACMDNQQLMYRHIAALLISEVQKRPEMRPKAEGHMRMMGLGSLPPEIGLRQAGYDKKQQLAELAQVLELDIPAYLQNNQPYLTWEEAREMRKQGFDFGAHSIDHPRFQGIEPQEQIRQVHDSVETVCSQLQLPYRAFAFPFEDRGLPHGLLYRMVDGEAPLADISFGTSGMRLDKHPAIQQRIDLERPKATVLRALKVILFKNYLQSLVGANRIKRPR